LALLSQIDPLAYERSRNHLNGAVTRLSPYLRHGVLSLAEVRDAAVAKAGSARRAFKLIQELAWRDYFQRVWDRLGQHIWSDLEPYKTGYRATDYADELPDDLLRAETGVDYIDHFVRELYATGYLHNHARLWMAAYVVHGRRVKWQAGARWFLSHLLDGDEASNNLSWQWCASTFSAKPYLFNRENVRKFTGGRFAERDADDPFDDSYEAIAGRLFRDDYDPTEPLRRFDLRTRPDEASQPVSPANAERTLVWVHDGMLSPAHPAVAVGAMHWFVWDDAWVAQQKLSAHRIDFMASALFCPAIHPANLSVADLLLEAAREGGCDAIATGATPDPRLKRTIDTLSRQIKIDVIPDRPFVELKGSVDLARFSKYWSKAEKALV
jgi:deoxyribodipyrimidine photo-lyase